MSFFSSSSASERVDWTEKSAFEFLASETEFGGLDCFWSTFGFTVFFLAPASSFALHF